MNSDERTELLDADHRTSWMDDQRAVILVDDDDEPIGTMRKLSAHQTPGHLHRAFSIFIVDATGRVLLQQRAATKYHFAGRWTNTCCSHPEPGQGTLEAAHIRLAHEMGLRDVELREVGQFRYCAIDPESGLVEHELDHVIIGATAAQPAPNPDECDDFKWVTSDELRQMIRDHPERVTPWLAPAFGVVCQHTDEASS